MDFITGYEFLRYFVPACTLVFFFLMLIQTLTFWRRYHINPLVEGKNDRIQLMIRNYKVCILAALILTIILFTWFPGYYWIAVPFTYLDSAFVKLTGSVVLVLSIFFVRFSESQMNRSWRIGVDHNEKPLLVTTGIYRHARNPIALGMILVLAGYFMTMPNAVTFTCMVSGIILANIRIRIEEAYLRDKLGEEYDEYFKRTRKWV
jgi:protein-S-isoprenylcysteine O-methyltransferase Ste14